MARDGDAWKGPGTRPGRDFRHAVWDDGLGKVLASQIGIDLTEAHWKVIRFLREDYKTQGETATSRRVQTVGGTPIKEQFVLLATLVVRYVDGYSIYSARLPGRPTEQNPVDALNA